MRNKKKTFQKWICEYGARISEALGESGFPTALPTCRTSHQQRWRSQSCSQGIGFLKAATAPIPSVCLGLAT